MSLHARIYFRLLTGCSAADLSQTFEIDEMWKDEQVKQEFRKIFDDLRTKITTDGEAKLSVPTPADRKFTSAAQRFPEQKATIQWINAQGNSDEDETTINDLSIYSDMLTHINGANSSAYGVSGEAEKHTVKPSFKNPYDPTTNDSPNSVLSFGIFFWPMLAILSKFRIVVFHGGKFKFETGSKSSSVNYATACKRVLMKKDIHGFGKAADGYIETPLYIKGTILKRK
eukprot:gene13407-14785_t